MANGLSPNDLVGIEKFDNVGVENSGITVVTVLPKNETFVAGDDIPDNWPFAIVTVVKPDPVNTFAPIIVTEGGIVILVKPLQLWNALAPILVIWFPIVTLVTPVFPSQILFGIAPL